MMTKYDVYIHEGTNGSIFASQVKMNFFCVEYMVISCSTICAVGHEILGKYSSGNMLSSSFKERSYFLRLYESSPLKDTCFQRV